jgi:hypothetical protein
MTAAESASSAVTAPRLTIVLVRAMLPYLSLVLGKSQSAVLIGVERGSPLGRPLADSPRLSQLASIGAPDMRQIAQFGFKAIGFPCTMSAHWRAERTLESGEPKSAMSQPWQKTPVSVVVWFRGKDIYSICSNTSVRPAVDSYFLLR